MPLFVVEIPETHTRISRPILTQIVNDVMKRFKDLPFREFRFAGEMEQYITPGSAFDTGAFNRQLNDNYVELDVIDEPDEEYGRSYVATPDLNRSIISCPKTLIDFYPIYKNRKVVITLKVVSSSRVRLNGLITRIKSGMDRSQTLFTHQISYDYDLPVACVELLNQTYHLMENKHGYGIEFIDWLREIKQSHVQMFTNVIGKRATLGVRENGVNVLSNFVDHDREPVKDSGDNNGVFSIEFDIEVRYQRPNEIRASYPPIIHNQFLPEQWFNKNKTYNYRDFAAKTSIAGEAAEKFKWNLSFSTPGKTGLGVKEPEFDDWGKDIYNSKMKKLLTSLVVVDEGDLRNFFDLRNDIVDHHIPEAFLKALAIEPRAMLYDGKHMLLLKAYKLNDTIRPEHIQIDSNLKIRMDYDLNPRGYYHLVVCFNKDPTTIPDYIWDELLCEKEALIIYFSFFGDKYADKLKKIIAEIDNDVCLTREIINDIIKDLIEDGEDFDNGKLYVDYSPRRTKLNYSVEDEI